MADDADEVDCIGGGRFCIPLEGPARSLVSAVDICPQKVIGETRLTKCRALGGPRLTRVAPLSPRAPDCNLFLVRYRAAARTQLLTCRVHSSCAGLTTSFELSCLLLAVASPRNREVECKQ